MYLRTLLTLYCVIDTRRNRNYYCYYYYYIWSENICGLLTIFIAIIFLKLFLFWITIKFLYSDSKQNIFLKIQQIKTLSLYVSYTLKTDIFNTYINEHFSTYSPYRYEQFIKWGFRFFNLCTSLSREWRRFYIITLAEAHRYYNSYCCSNIYRGIVKVIYIYILYVNIMYDTYILVGRCTGI